MKKPVFFTKFDLPNRKLRYFDPHDSVDRLAYVENSRMINNFMNAGKVLELAYRAENAFYTNPLDIEDGVGIPTPVYAVDPVVASAIKESLDTQIESKTAELSAIADKSAEAGALKPTGDPDVPGSPVPEETA